MLKETPPERVFRYPVSNFVTTSLMLSSLILPLIENHRIILAPLGPKTFTLACLIQAIVNTDVDVWRISSGVSSTPIDVEADGEITVVYLQFEVGENKNAEFPGLHT